MITTIDTNNSKTRMNGDIRYPEVRVISADGAQLGIMSSRDAQLMARDAGLDLVEISPNAIRQLSKSSTGVNTSIKR